MSMKLSWEPAASQRPSGEYLSSEISSRRCRFCVIIRPSLVSKTRNPPFLNPTAANFPSWLYAHERALSGTLRIVSMARSNMSHCRTVLSSPAVMMMGLDGCVARPHSSPSQKRPTESKLVVCPCVMIFWPVSQLSSDDMSNSKISLLRSPTSRLVPSMNIARTQSVFPS